MDNGNYLLPNKEDIYFISIYSEYVDSKYIDKLNNDIKSICSDNKIKFININNSDMNCYGSYMNVVLTTKQYNQLLVKMQSKELLDKFIEELSGNIEQGTYKNDKPYNDEYPNAHYERLSRYFTYWQKHKDDNMYFINK